MTKNRRNPKKYTPEEDAIILNAIKEKKSVVEGCKEVAPN
jgi:hypothetical protein